MWRYWINGIFGLLVVILVYFGIPLWLKSILLIICGVVIALVSFGSIVRARIDKEIIDYEKSQQE